MVLNYCILCEKWIACICCWSHIRYVTLLKKSYFCHKSLYGCSSVSQVGTVYRTLGGNTIFLASESLSSFVYFILLWSFSIEFWLTCAHFVLCLILSHLPVHHVYWTLQHFIFCPSHGVSLMSVAFADCIHLNISEVNFCFLSHLFSLLYSS